MSVEGAKFNFIHKFMLYIPVKLIPAFSTVLLIVYLYKNLPFGHYTSYSIALTCSLMMVQLGTGWVGNSFIYFSSLSANKSELISNSLTLLIIIAPIVGMVAAFFAHTLGAKNSFWLVILLSVVQVFYFFFLSVLQVYFRVKEQLWATCIQVAVQFSLVFIYFNYSNIDYRGALLALFLGYGVGATYLYSCFRSTVRVLELKKSLKSDVRRFCMYGIALIPWMLGVLLLANIDKFFVSYFGFELSDSYISSKDLFVGASGLISMPMLMLVHPILINSFNKGKRFKYPVLEESLRYMVICFALLWVFLHLVGFDLFFFFAEKDLVVAGSPLFFSFLSVFFASVSIYLQKRYEVHRKWPLLAAYSLSAAIFSITLVAIGGTWFGILGASLGGAVGQGIYCFLVLRSLAKKISLVQCLLIPLVWVAGAYMILVQAKFFFQTFVGSSPNWVGIGAWVICFISVSIGFVVFLVRWSFLNERA